MFFKTLSVAALALAASAQQMNLTAALTSLPQLSNLTTYLGLFPDLVQSLSTMKNVTLLAPNNAAFTKALSGPAGEAFNASDAAVIQAFFTYHVLNGTYYASAVTGNASFLPTALTPASNATTLNPQVVEAIKIGSSVKFVSGLLTESTVTSPNHNFTGGTIHIIDTLLSLPQNISQTLVPLNLTSAAGALGTANIAGGALPQNVTAFIPNNAAFQAIGNLLSNISIANLTGILGYHLVPNVTAYSTDLTNGMKLPSFIPNENLTITIDGDNVFVNSAKVLVPNVLCSEGVIHVIDAVLNPANTTAKPVLSETGGKPAFAGATKGSMVPYTSGIPAPSTVPMAATMTGGVAAEQSTAAAGSGAGSSSSGIAAMPTGMMGAAALFGGAAAVMNL